MSRISDRHEGTAGDQLDAFERTRAQEVRIVVEPEVAASASVQHTAWMLVNALARLQGVVARIELECPRDVTVRTRVVPLSNRDRLLGAIEDAAEQIGAVPMGKVRDDAFVLHIGPGGAPSSGLRVVGDAWSGGISTRAVGPGRGSALPFGPYVAACVAAAEVFKAARMKREAYVPAQAAFYSTWSHQSSIQPIDDGPVVLDGVALQADLAGVGAVGSAWVHALWATEGIRGAVQLIDNDPHGVDSTNLNRYALFGAGSVGRSKPDEAARLTAGSDIAWTEQCGVRGSYYGSRTAHHLSGRPELGARRNSGQVLRAGPWWLDLGSSRRNSETRAFGCLPPLFQRTGGAAERH
jgi:hypothetical protein